MPVRGGGPSFAAAHRSSPPARLRRQTKTSSASSPPSAHTCRAKSPACGPVSGRWSAARRAAKRRTNFWRRRTSSAPCRFAAAGFVRREPHRSRLHARRSFRQRVLPSAPRRRRERQQRYCSQKHSCEALMVYRGGSTLLRTKSASSRRRSRPSSVSGGSANCVPRQRPLIAALRRRRA